MTELISGYMTSSFFYLVIVVVGWSYILKGLNRNAPAITGAAKKAAADKAIRVIAKLFK